MANERLDVVHGMGPDAVGLVGKLTGPIAKAGGNIVDLRQDVLHGLFTIYLVVDMQESGVDPDGFRTMVEGIGAETGLQLAVEPYRPVARDPDKKNLLMILIGRDRPGIISTSSEMLGKYNANIEFSQTIAREGIFLMELLTDISHVGIPADNLKRTLTKNMEGLNIKAIFQDTQVFNKRKRVILFNQVRSFIDGPTMEEIMSQTGITTGDLSAYAAADSPLTSAQAALTGLDGLSVDVADALLGCIAPTHDTAELIQTLKVMGYKVVLMSAGLGLFADGLRKRLDIDFAYGVPHEVDEDARLITGRLNTNEPGSHDIDSVISEVMTREDMEPEDITVMTDEGCMEPLGIRLTFLLDSLLDLYNRGVLSKENMVGLLGSFGVPTLP